MHQPFVYAAFSQTAAALLTNISRGEIALVYTYQVSGHENRVAHLNAVYESREGHSLKVLSPSQFDTLDEFVRQVQQFVHNHESVIITSAESILQQNTQHWLQQLVTAAVSYRTSLIFVAEVYPFQLSKLHISSLTPLLSHQYWLPQLTSEESAQFVEYLENKLGKKTQISTQKIFEETGGNTWLIKEIVRQSPLELLEIIHSDAYQAKCDLLFDVYPDELKQVVVKIASKQLLSSLEERIFLQMKQLHVIFQNGEPPNHFQRSLSHFTTQEIIIDGSEIIINGVRVSNVFSPIEQQVFAYLHTQAGMIISRSELAAHFWPGHDYSDWALDRAVHRLKKKINQLGLPKSYLKTIRNIGYQVTLHI